jgi:hypothetical protein
MSAAWGKQKLREPDYQILKPPTTVARQTMRKKELPTEALLFGD